MQSFSFFSLRTHHGTERFGPLSSLRRIRDGGYCSKVRAPPESLSHAFRPAS